MTTQCAPPHRPRRSNSHGSVGLGLFIVQQIAHAHGGEVHVASSAHERTTIDATLPR